jgi:epoxyqueuosine reductase
VQKLRETIITTAHRLGFAAAGCAPLRPLEQRGQFLRDWLAEGRAGEMAWLAREPERRLDPRLRNPRLRSVISLAYPYIAPSVPSDDGRGELRGRIAAYALGPDYHDVVLTKARRVAALITELHPDAATRVYVDTGPVLEREWAAAAGLGWFGRNTNLINLYRGSYFFLAEIFTELEFEGPAEPYRDHCGTCRRCLDLCPTGALTDGLRLDPRLCISYLTIEHRSAIPYDMRSRMGNWIFGCDICQEVCPWNGDAGRAAAVNSDLRPPLSMVMGLDDDGFRRCYGRTAVHRAKRRGLLRNAAIALGNSGDPRAVPILARVMSTEPEGLVRGHAAWALGQFQSAEARVALERAWRCDPEPDVHAEIERALTELST